MELMSRFTAGRRRQVAAWALLLLVSACAVGPRFKKPAAPTDQDYGDLSLGPTASVNAEGGSAQSFLVGKEIPGDWWTVYGSTQLSQLVEQALRGNPNVTIAQSSLRQADELFKAQRAAYFPLLQGSFAASRARNANATIAPPTVDTNPTYNLYTAQLSVSYVPDVFGGVRRSVEAARAQVDVTRYQLQAIYVTLSSNVVVTAITEASLRDQISATEHLLELQHKLTEIARAQRGLGTASVLDLQAQQSAEAQTAALLPPLQKQLGQTEDALTALSGRLPAEAPMLTLRLGDFALPTELPLSLPSTLVAQRPDVQQAEANLHMASAQVGVSLASMLPQFALTANVGSSALKLNSLFSPYTGFWQAGASLTQILFDSGALLHRKRAADAALDQAAAQYRLAVITACQNVADTLRALQTDATALQAAVQADQAATITLDLAKQQYQLGTISQVALLNAEQSYGQAQIAVIQARANRYADTAGLFQALGGGWWNRHPGATP